MTSKNKPIPPTAKGISTRRTSGSNWAKLRSGTTLAVSAAAAAARRSNTAGSRLRRPPWLRAAARRYAAAVRSMAFERVIGLAVIVNGICTALEVDVRDEDTPRLAIFLDFMESFFVIFFLFESISKAVVFGPRVVFRSRTYCFELFLALLCAADVWFIDFTNITLVGSALNAEDIGLNSLPMLRIVRFVKLMKQGELALIARCFFPAFGTMVYVGIFLLLIVFMFSIPLVRLVGKNPIWQNHPEITQLFGNIPRAVFGLLQMVINPDTDTMRIIFEEQPWTAPFFLLFVGMTTFTTMSIIVGSVTDSFKSLSDAEREAQGKAEKDSKQKIRRQLLRDLRAADKAEVGLSGALTLAAFTQQVRSPRFQEALKALGVQSQEVEDLLILLEVDGHVYYEELVNALGLMGQGAQATQILWLKAHIAEEAKRMERRLETVEGRLDSMDASIKEGFRSMHEQLQKLPATV